jgi:hypothetical protein
MGVSLTSFLSLSGTMIILISTSWVSEVIGMSHCTQLGGYFYSSICYFTDERRT